MEPQPISGVDTDYNSALAAQVAALRQRLEVLEVASEHASLGDLGDYRFMESPVQRQADNEDLPDPMWDTLHHFVEGFVRNMFVAPAPASGHESYIWCNNWEDHPDAYWTLLGLWRTAEQARAEDWPTGSAERTLGWYNLSFLPLMKHMCKPSGTFALCRGGHQPPKKLGSS